MKKVFLIVIIGMCYIGLYSQSINPDDLIYICKYKTKHGEKVVKTITYCKKDSTPYTGFINGKVYYEKYNISIAKVFYGNMYHITKSIESDYFISGICPECDSIKGLIVEGEFVNGKENGHWNYYNINDSTKLAECNYNDGLIYGPIYLYEKNANSKSDTVTIEPSHCRHCRIIFYNQKKLKKEW